MKLAPMLLALVWLPSIAIAAPAAASTGNTSITATSPDISGIAVTSAKAEVAPKKKKKKVCHEGARWIVIIWGFAECMKDVAERNKDRGREKKEKKEMEKQKEYLAQVYAPGFGPEPSVNPSE